MLNPLLIKFEDDATYLYEGEETAGDSPLAVKYLDEITLDDETIEYQWGDTCLDTSDTLVRFETGSLTGVFAKSDVWAVISTNTLTQGTINFEDLSAATKDIDDYL